MAGKHLTDLTPEKRKELFLECLRERPNVTKAARWAGYTRQYVYDLRDADPEFAKAWNEALEESIELCEGELHRRAFDGTLKPVFQGGEKVGSIREYSDTLAIFLMKAHKPEKYRETTRTEITGKNGKAIQIEYINDWRSVSQDASGDSSQDERDSY